MALYLNVSQPMGGALGWDEKKRLDEAEKRLRKALRGRDAGEMEQAAEEMKAVLQR